MNELRARLIAAAYRAALAATGDKEAAITAAADAGAAYDRRVCVKRGSLPAARIEAVLSMVASHFGVRPEQITARHWLTREMAGARWIAARLLVDAGMSRNQLAPVLGFAARDGVTRALAALDRRPDLLVRLSEIRRATLADGRGAHAAHG